MEQEKPTVITALFRGIALQATPEGREEIQRLKEQEEKTAREKARGMTDEEWRQTNEEINRNILNAGKSLGETAKESALQIQAFIDMVAPYLPDRPKHSKKRGRKTTW